MKQESFQPKDKSLESPLRRLCPANAKLLSLRSALKNAYKKQALPRPGSIFSIKA